MKGDWDLTFSTRWDKDQNRNRFNGQKLLSMELLEKLIEFIVNWDWKKNYQMILN